MTKLTPQELDERIETACKYLDPTHASDIRYDIKQLLRDFAEAVTPQDALTMYGAEITSPGLIAERGGYGLARQETLKRTEELLG